MSLNARIRLKRFFLINFLGLFSGMYKMYKRRFFLLCHLILKNGICADAPVHEEQEYVIRIDFSACSAEKMQTTSFCAFSGSYERVKTCDINISGMEDRKTLIFLPYT
jgi:hypothetical protein